MSTGARFISTIAMLVGVTAGSASLAASAGASRLVPPRSHQAPMAVATTAASAAITTCNNGNPCDDGNPCTFDDTCNAIGVCVGHLPPSFQYCSSASTTIPSVGAASPYPSTVSVSNAGPTLCKVRVILDGVFHTNPDDIDMMLSGPGGQNAKIMSDVGGTQDLGGLSLILDDSAGSSMPDGGPLFAGGENAPLGGGTWKPTDVNDGVDTFPAPAPAPAGGSAFSVFNGSNPNGTWKLWVVDDKNLDSGSLNRWCVQIRFICNSDAQCDDGGDCTEDKCVNGQCISTDYSKAPPEVQAVVIAPNKQTVSWSPASTASSYDIVRGALGALPVGPGGDDETCFNSVPGTSIVDNTLPAPGTGFWYLVRGENCFDTGVYGSQSNGMPQVTNTCPF
jgi:proprotein convertase P-domain-containing protein